MLSPPLPVHDLDAILDATVMQWREMRGGHLFLTGGTGFFGAWLTESFLHINRIVRLDARLTILTRDPQAFLARLPHLARHPALTLVEGDVRSFRFPSAGFTHAIHAATEASAKQLAEAPEEMRSVIVEGTRRVLDFTQHAGVRKLLYLSSGAVYGVQPAHISHIAEMQPCAPGTVYGEAKLAAEALCAKYPKTEIKIARPFAFLGPHLPLHMHFAAGNFLAEALGGRPIHVASDGTALRSYLYAADLATHLWTMLFRAPALRPYNIGSEDAVSIAALAHVVAAAHQPALSVSIARQAPPGATPAQYVPSAARARRELGLRTTVQLSEAIRRTLRWHGIESGAGPS